MSSRWDVCPGWCSDCQRIEGPDVAPDDVAVVHRQDFEAAGWPFASAELYARVYQVDGLNERAIAVYLPADMYVSSPQARALAASLLAAADALDAAGGRVTTDPVRLRGES